MRYTMDPTFFSPDEFDPTTNGNTPEPASREPNGSQPERNSAPAGKPGSDEDEADTRSALMDTYNPS